MGGSVTGGVSFGWVFDSSGAGSTRSNGGSSGFEGSGVVLSGTLDSCAGAGVFAVVVCPETDPCLHSVAWIVALVCQIAHG